MNRDEKNKLYILLIEDRSEDIDITKQALRQNEVPTTLHIARDGETALNYLLARDESGEEPLPDLIMLDLNLPKVDGRQVLEEIHEHSYLRSIPTIVITVSERDKDIARSYDSGASGYITKPIDFEEFAKIIDIVTKYWQICHTPDPRTFLEDDG